MYSHEISDILSKNSYIISPDMYMKLVTTSPQIKHIKYNPYSIAIQ